MWIYFTDQSILIIISLQEEGTWLLIHTNWSISIKINLVICDVLSLHWWWERWVDLIFFQEQSIYLTEVFTKCWLLLAKMKPLICDVIPHSHLIAARRNNVKGLLIHGNWYLDANWMIPVSCDLFTSLMAKGDRFNPVAASHPRIWQRYSPKSECCWANIKWFICDVIPDSHIIGAIRHRTINPHQWIFPSKWTDSSVMSYIYTTDEKGERYNPCSKNDHVIFRWRHSWNASQFLSQNKVIHLWCNSQIIIFIGRIMWGVIVFAYN